MDRERERERERERGRKGINNRLRTVKCTSKYNKLIVRSSKINPKWTSVEILYA